MINGETAVKAGGILSVLTLVGVAAGRIVKALRLKRLNVDFEGEDSTKRNEEEEPVSAALMQQIVESIDRLREDLKEYMRDISSKLEALRDDHSAHRERFVEVKARLEARIDQLEREHAEIKRQLERLSRRSGEFATYNPTPPHSPAQLSSEDDET